MEELEKEKLSELQDRKEAEELAKLETRGILSLASEVLVIRVSCLAPLLYALTLHLIIICIRVKL